MIHRHRMGPGIAIEIDRPSHLGALNTECFDQIEAILEEARHDSSVAWVALFSRLPKGFCAGGDVKRLYEDFHSQSSFAPAARFFETEYRVDQKIWDFPKPILALTHGITLGGGLGLIRGASHRIVDPASTLGMPEILIGLYPDVGATFFLQTIPAPWRELIAFTAMRFGPAQALQWGVATHCLPQNEHARVLEALSQISWEGTPHDHVLMSQFLDREPKMALSPVPALPDRKILEVLEAHSASELWDRALALDHPLFNGSLLMGSPLSAAIISEQLQRGRRLSRTQAFEWEYHLSMACLKQGDFFAGVRSRLIDKSVTPVWKYAHPSQIPVSVLGSILG